MWPHGVAARGPDGEQPEAVAARRPGRRVFIAAAARGRAGGREQRAVEAAEVAGGRDERAGRARPARVLDGEVLALAEARADAAHARALVVARVAQAERADDAPLQLALERAAGDALDQLAEHHVVRVGVVKAARPAGSRAGASARSRSARAAATA